MRYNFVVTLFSFKEHDACVLTALLLLWWPSLPMHYTCSRVLCHHPNSWVPSVVLAVLSLVQPTLFCERELGTSQVANDSLAWHAMLYNLGAALQHLLYALHHSGFLEGYVVALLRLNTYEAKSLQLTFTACQVAQFVLNIWSYLRLPDDCYPVVDQPCQSVESPHRNLWLCPAAHFILIASSYSWALLIRKLSREFSRSYSAIIF